MLQGYLFSAEEFSEVGEGIARGWANSKGAAEAK
jgi:hypothetical protein